MVGVRFEDEILGAFKQIGEISYQVQMEQMSKAGYYVQTAMRNALTSNRASSVTRVNSSGTAYLEGNHNLPLGVRQSMQRDEEPGTPENMESYIGSFLMEKHETLVVGGAFPTFRPTLREEGRVVGIGTEVTGVAQKTISILHRMDTGEENSYYDKSTQLADIPPGGYNFMNEGKSKSANKVRALLTEGFFKVYRQAEKHYKKEKVYYG